MLTQQQFETVIKAKREGFITEEEAKQLVRDSFGLNTLATTSPEQLGQPPFCSDLAALQSGHRPASSGEKLCSEFLAAFPDLSSLTLVEIVDLARLASLLSDSDRSLVASFLSKHTESEAANA
jgi:hypothetical protein